MCIGVCLYVFLCTGVAFRVQKIPLGLELQMAVSHHVGVGGLNLGPVEEQPVLLTTEPSLLPCQYSLFKPSPALLLNSLFCIQTHTTFPHFSTSPLELASTACLPLEQKDPSRDDVRIASLEKTLSMSGSYLAAHGADTSESPSDIPTGLRPAMSTTGKESLARMENPY